MQNDLEREMINHVEKFEIPQEWVSMSSCGIDSKANVYRADKYQMQCGTEDESISPYSRSGSEGR